MMTPSEILNIIGSTTKRTEKEALIKKYDSDSMRDLYNLALNPYIVFNQSPVTNFSDAGDGTEYELILDLVAVTSDRDVLKSFCSRVHHEYDEDAIRLFNKIIKKDLDCGIGAKTVNKAIGNYIPDYRVAKASEQKKIEKMSFPSYINEKIDGARATITIFQDGSMVTRSSSGREVQQMGKIYDSLKPAIYGTQIERQIPIGGIQFDGEMLQFDKETDKPVKRQISNGVFNKMTNGNAKDEDVDKMCFIVFDVLPSCDCIEKGGSRLDLRARYESYISKISNSFFHFKVVDFGIVYNINAALEKANEYIENGGEGAIVKEMYSLYKTKRLTSWVKIKTSMDVDVVVTGWTPHSKKTDQIGALGIASSDGIITGNIGTGHWLTEQKRKDLYNLAMNEELEGMILHIKTMEITTDREGNKRFYIPSIEEQRLDKTEADNHDKIMDMVKGK